mgnify:CR=1 FL=1
MYPSLFNNFFTPPTIVVVSEERLKKAELEQKQRQLDDLDDRLEQLNAYRGELAKDIESAQEPQSLEEALTGE